MRAFLGRLEKKHITKYFEYLKQLYLKPNSSEFYTAHEEASDGGEEEDDDVKNRKTNKVDNIKIFALNNISTLPTLVKQEKLNVDLMDNIVKFILEVVCSKIDQEGASSEDTVKEHHVNKLFSFVQSLQKLKISSRKGFRDEEQLWIGYINS